MPNLPSSPASTPYLEQGQRKDLLIRAPIHTASPGSPPQHTAITPHPSHTPQPLPSPGKRRPLPPPKPKPKPLNTASDSPMDEPQPQYIVPGSPDGREGTYFTLSPTGQHIPEDVPQAAYEEMEYDEEELNRNPPPVWKPPTRKYTRSLERGSTADFSGVRNIPPAQPPLHASQKKQPPRKPLRPQMQVPSEGFGKPVPLSRSGKGPPPPVKPKPMSPPPQVGDVLTNVLNDPNLKEKLQERKQELYADPAASRASVTSWDGPDPLENYEEVCFDSFANDDTSHVFTRGGDHRVTLPPRRHNDGSMAAMLQCPPKEEAQAYLKFHRSRSPSPQDVVEQWSTMDSHTSRTLLTPPVRQKNVNTSNVSNSQPSLPPRDPQQNRKSPHLVRKPLPPAREAQSGALAPRHSLKKGKSHSEEDLLSEKMMHSYGHQKPRPSSSVETPPPLPSRVITSDKNATGQRPLSRRDLDLPMPLPEQQPAGHDVPPPVPLRHPNASGATRMNHSISVPETSVQRSAGDYAPPVPARGREGHSPDPSALQRSFATLAVAPEAKKRPRPPMKPPNVGGVDQQTQPAQAWDSRLVEGEQKAPISRPRPPVSSKPARKPQVTPKPVHLQRTFPTSAQNGETPPPLPPR